MSNIKISHCKNLIVKIFVIGYSQRGESVIVAFLDKESNNVLYTIVIDSFTYKGINKTLDLLNQYNISSIDMLCWSHPDYDHTKGLDVLINQFCNVN
jgi:beta-lactamase superfamily II metal-dependent hydrolase